jgi:threonylcarbamoyladenosine tRNA methylthiotransferase MtaB
MDIVEECGLTFLHVFPYSEREGTPAAKMPSVDKAIRKERAARLRGLGEKQVQKFLYNNINKDVQAIVEKGNIARAENFAPVEISEGLEPGSLVRMYTTGIKGSMLTGDLIS